MLLEILFFYTIVVCVMIVYILPTSYLLHHNISDICRTVCIIIAFQHVEVTEAIPAYVIHYSKYILHIMLSYDTTHYYIAMDQSIDTMILELC